MPLGNKSKEGYLQPLQNSAHIPFFLELNYLRENQSVVIKATHEAEEALRVEVAKNDVVRQLLDKQKGVIDDLQNQIERARADKAKLLAAKHHFGEMERNNLANNAFVSADV